MDAVAAGNLPDDVMRDILLRIPIFLYNPFLNQHQTLSTKPYKVPYQKDKVIGFGYDSVKNDYKVVFWYELEYNYARGYNQLAQVYSLGMNCWRNLEIPDDDITPIFGKDDNKYAVFLNGGIHWLGYRRRRRCRNPNLKGVISFNVNSEEFQWFPLPEYVDLHSVMKIYNVYKDLLCVVYYVARLDGYYYDIWVMSKYGVQESWTRLHTLKRACPDYDNREFGGILMNGELLWENFKYGDDVHSCLTVEYPDDGKSMNIDQRIGSRFFIHKVSLVSLIIRRIELHPDSTAGQKEHAFVNDVEVAGNTVAPPSDVAKLNVGAAFHFGNRLGAILTMDAVVGNLPDDVMREILLRIPVKSILRFKSSSGRQLFIRLLTHDPFNVYLDLELPFTPYSLKGYRIIGSCNGLVCFYDGTQFFIYNPLLNQHKYKTLPLPNNVSGSGQYGYDKVIGFCYDSLSDDYKVVFWYNKEDNKQLVEAQVYTLGMNCWTKVETPDQYITVEIPYGKNSQAFLNGVIHWLGYGFSGEKLVITFDVSSEVFQWFPLPCYVGGAHINVYRDMLCVFDYVATSVNSNYDIFVMSKYGVQDSWRKLQLRVIEPELPPQPGNSLYRYLIGIMMNGEFVWENYIYTSVGTWEQLAMDTVAGNLPDDVLGDILLRIPVKSIIRFRLVTHQDPFNVYLELQHRTLPRPNNVSARYGDSMVIGFGYDSVSSDYKVVFWYSKEDNDQQLVEAQVYTLGLNYWRKVETPDHYITVDNYGTYLKSQAFLNGVIHWLGYGFNQKKLVISFNVSSEVFQWFPLPDYVHNCAVKVYRDMLCVGPAIGMVNSNYDIWVMSKYGVKESWTKLQFVLEQELPQQQPEVKA
ncbi:hypothetical protein CCACVL1_27914 [Corchorus capsularis]|uniref:Uncharacterized protein n=1 Tax=Corchorus capsularis TaxID=210143 RepID=A0A1R3G875_COCAP|nr:hypothetical protein CCACVL1_27914 [Corchorus capsularis]